MPDKANSFDSGRQERRLLSVVAFPMEGHSPHVIHRPPDGITGAQCIRRPPERLQAVVPGGVGNVDPATRNTLEPCLRMTIVRRGSDVKKRVAFAETASIIWNDDPAPFVVISDDDTRPESNKEPEDEQMVTPKERRRRKVVTAVVCTTFLLLTASALFVLITLFHASAIDEAGRASAAARQLHLHPSVQQMLSFFTLNFKLVKRAHHF